MRSDDHNVWAHVKFLLRRLAGPVRNPGTRIHVGNSESIDALRPSSKPVRRPLKENFIEASGLVMRGAGRWTRQAGPFTTTLTENSKFAALFGRPIQNSRVVGYEVRSGPHCVCNFFTVCYRQVLSRGLSARCERSEKTKNGQLHFEPPYECLALHFQFNVAHRRHPSPGAASAIMISRTRSYRPFLGRGFLEDLYHLLVEQSGHRRRLHLLE